MYGMPAYLAACVRRSDSPDSASGTSSEDEADCPPPGLTCATCMPAIVGTGNTSHDSTFTHDDPRWGHDTLGRRRRMQAEARAAAILAAKTSDQPWITHADVWAVLFH